MKSIVLLYLEVFVFEILLQQIKGTNLRGRIGFIEENEF